MPSSRSWSTRNDQWIRERTGIAERRILKGEGLATSDLAVPAVLELLAKTDTAPGDVDLVICCTVTGDFRFPDTGTLIAHKAGLVNAYGYDLSAACSGFLFGLHAGAQYVAAGTYKKVIVVGADKMSSIVDYTDRATCILFGDGAGAVMLEPTEEAIGVGHARLFSDGSGGAELNMEAGGSYLPPSIETVTKKQHAIRQNGRVVYKHAVRGMSSAIGKVLADEELESRRYRVGGAAPGQPAHHRGRRQRPRLPHGARHAHDPTLRQHDRGDDSAVFARLRIEAQ